MQLCVGRDGRCNSVKRDFRGRLLRFPTGSTQFELANFPGLPLLGHLVRRLHRQRHCDPGRGVRQTVGNQFAKVLNQLSHLRHHHRRLLRAFHLHRLHARPMDLSARHVSDRSIHAAAIGVCDVLHVDCHRHRAVRV